MVPINGKPMLGRQIELLKKSHINNITIVTGYLGNKIKIPDVSYIRNRFYRSNEQNYSLFCARNQLNDSVIISFADIIFDEDNVLLNGNKIIKIKKNIKNCEKNQKIVEFLGLIKLSKKGSSIFLKKFQYLNKNHKGKFHSANSFKKSYIMDMIQEMIDSGLQITPVFVDGKWFEIDTLEDIRIVEKLIKKI